jgi:hypothetical protein
MRCRSGCAPDCALTFFASPKKVSKERRAQDRAAARFLALLVSRGVWLNSLRSNNASPDPLAPALLSPAFKGGGDKDKDKDKDKRQYQTPAHAPKAALWRAFGGSAVGIPWLPRRYEEASSADGGGSGLALFERSEFSQTPPSSSNAAVPAQPGDESGSPFLCLLSFGEAKESECAVGRTTRPRTQQQPANNEQP